MSVKDLCQEISRRRLEAIERRSTIYPRNNPIASDIGPCDREMVLQILHWKDRPPFKPDLLARLERGRVIEDWIIRELSALGISVRVERSPFEIKDAHGRVILRGKVDGFIAWNGKDYPFEAKSVNPNLFNRIEIVADLTGYMERWPRQVQSYLYGNNLEEGMILLDDCMGHWKLLDVPLDYGQMETILKRCESTVHTVYAIQNKYPNAEQAMPAYHSDASVCVRCWAYGRVCFPPMQYEGMEQLSPEDVDRLDPMLNRMEELSEAADEHDAIEKAVKEEMKRRGIKQAIVGRWLIQGKEIVTHRKSQEAKDLVSWRTTITRVGND